MSWSFMQTSFLGGLWSGLATGRMESQAYKTALAVCTNYYPIEQGALMRRQGTRLLTHTRRGNKAKLIPFDFSIIQPYQLELTNGFARFYEGTSQVFVNPFHGVLNISTANPAVVTTSELHGFSTGDDVVFQISGPPCRAPLLCGRQFTITKIDNWSFSIADALTQASIDGSTLGYTPAPLGDDKVFKILELTTPYTTAQLVDNLLHFVQDETTLTLLRGDTPPYTLQQGASFFTLTQSVFTDGPYLAINITSTTLTPSGTSGSVTVTASATTGINGGSGFLATDVGRFIRLESQAANWNSGTTYAVGDLATGTDNQVYTSLVAGNINHNPINDITNWAVSAAGIVWNWGTITAVADTTHCTVTLSPVVDPTTGIAGPALLNTNATTVWRLGLWGNTPGLGWPTCGGYHENRFWFGGSAGNRFDASVSVTGQHFTFSPTLYDGTVTDAHAISGTFTAHDVNQVFWFLPEEDGLYVGTQAGEWRIRASTLDDPVTPTSIQVRRITTFGGANTQALCTPRTMIFVQRQRRKIYEFVDIESWQSLRDGNNLTQSTPAISVNGIQDIVFQQEPTSMIWARREDRVLVGCSYKRSGDNAYAGWHNVTLGSGRATESLSVGPTADGLAEALYLITADPNNDANPRFVEMLTPMFDDQTPDQQAWFVDTGLVPCCATVTGGGVTFYGLWLLNGKTVCPFIAGLDCGPNAVSNGSVSVAFGSDPPDANDPGGHFTQAFLDSVSAENLNYGGYQVSILVSSQAGPDPAVTTPSVMAYDGAGGGPSGAVSDINGNGAVIDWNNGFLVGYSASGNAGLRKFLLDSPGTLSQEATVAQMGSPGTLGAASGGGIEVMTNGDIVFITNAANSGTISAVEESSLLYEDSFGVASNSTAPSTNTRILGPFIFAAVKNHGIDYLVNASISTTGEIYTIPVDNFAGGGVIAGTTASFFAGQVSACVCQGYNNSDWGNAYVLGRANWGGGSTTPFGLYRVGTTVGDMNWVANVTPAQVDATWTNFFLVQGLAFDQTDGNVITTAQTTDAVTNQQYLLKLNTITGAVMWKVPVNNICAGLDANMHRSRIVNGTYFYLGSGNVMYIINTATGAFTTSTHVGFGNLGEQISDDVSNSIIGYGSCGGAGTTAIGNWMATLGHNPVSNMWCRVFLGIVAGQSRGTAAIVDTVGAPIGFCYTSQWQLLRPDAGQDAGTRAGPSFGKKRRLHWWAGSFYRTRSMSIGYGFGATQLKPMKIPGEGLASVNAPTLFSGTITTPVDDTYSFNGQLCGQQSKAYPGIILALSGYLEATDK